MTAIAVFSPIGADSEGRSITGALVESGIDAFWFPWTGERIEERAVELLASSRCALVLWTAHAASADRDYRDLAALATAEGKALILRLDDAIVPEAMAGVSAYDLRGKRARKSSLFMLDVVAAAQAKVAGLDPPLPRAPRQLLLKRLAVAIPTLVAAVAVAVGLYRDFGIDKIASPAESRDWAAIRPGSCQDLRKFLRKHPDGVNRETASSLLASSEVREVATRRTIVHRSQIYAMAGLGPSSSTREDAQGAARARATADAEAACKRNATALEAKLLKHELAEGQSDCAGSPGNFRCSWSGEAMCTLAVEEPTVQEVCASPPR